MVISNSYVSLPEGTPLELGLRFQRKIPRLDDLKKGFLYFCGRDAGLRPALVMRPSRCPPGMACDQFGRLFVFCMEYFLRYMMIPGKVENIVVIVDLKDLSYSQLPPVAAVLELKDVLVKQDAGRRLFVSMSATCPSSSVQGSVWCKPLWPRNNARRWDLWVTWSS